MHASFADLAVGGEVEQQCQDRCLTGLHVNSSHVILHGTDGSRPRLLLVLRLKTHNRKRATGQDQLPRFDQDKRAPLSRY
jgi:hypothetical protein